MHVERLHHVQLAIAEGGGRPRMFIEDPFGNRIEMLESTTPA
jgi:hypothetical protein